MNRNLSNLGPALFMALLILVASALAVPAPRAPWAAFAGPVLLALGLLGADLVRRRRWLHRPSHRKRELSVPEERLGAPTTGISFRLLRSPMADMVRRRTTKGYSASCSERREEGPFVRGLPRRGDGANLKLR